MGVIKNLKEIVGLNSEEEFEEEEILEEEFEEKIEDEEKDKEKEPKNFMARFSKKPKEEEILEEEDLEEEQNGDDYSTVFIDPKKFDDCRKIAKYIKSGKMITINLENLNSNISQRIMDFLAGAMEIKNASFAKVAKNVYTIVPENMKIMYEGKKREKKLINLEREEK